MLVRVWDRLLGEGARVLGLEDMLLGLAGEEKFGLLPPQ